MATEAYIDGDGDYIQGPARINLKLANEDVLKVDLGADSTFRK